MVLRRGLPNKKGRKSPTMVLEAIFNGGLRIWRCIFGSPGSMNDIKILDSSRLRYRILDCNNLPDFTYTVKGSHRNQGFSRVDGTYRKWAIPILSISDAISEMDKHLAHAPVKEVLRKDLKRALGVVVLRCHILFHPCVFCDQVILKKMMCVRIILHNMVVDSRPKRVQKWAGDGGREENGPSFLL